MPEDVKTTLMLMYSDQILRIVEQKDELTNGDFQGAIEAVVLTLLRGNHDAMYDKMRKMAPWKNS